MSKPSSPKPLRSVRLQKAIDLLSAQQFDAAEEELKGGIEEALEIKDKAMEALFYSTLGLLYKLKKDFKTAWRHYEKAEKLLPEDPALKLISSRLLIDIFCQYDTAIKKVQKVLKIVKGDWVFCHQAQITLGLAHLKKGDKKKALKHLVTAMEGDFEGMLSAGNIDFKLLEALLKKETGYEEGKTYLEKALAFAQKTKEEKYILLIQKLLENFPAPKNLDK